MEEENILLVPFKHLHENRQNRRKRFDKINELADELLRVGFETW